jgi:hypothetical protein
MEQWLSVQDWFTIFAGIFIETLILGSLTQWLLTRSTDKGQKHLEQTIEKLEQKIQRISVMEQQMLKSMETWMFSIKEELKDEIRGQLQAQKGRGS